MRLANRKSRVAAEEAFKDRYGREPPDWLLDSAKQAWHYDTCVTQIAGPLGFYHNTLENDPLPRATPESHHEPFDNELESMTPVATQLVSELLEGDVAIEEMPYGGKYRTDLTICDIDKDALKRRMRLSGSNPQSLVDEWKYLKGYRYLANSDPVTKEEFIDDGPYSSNTTNRKVWNRLVDEGLLAIHHGLGTVVNLPIHVTAHAVELKQKDWETAYEQAIRATDPHKHGDSWKADRDPKKYGYADYCWVVMDAAYVDRALEHREKFENGVVGLISLDEGGAVKHIDARGRAPPDRSLDREHVNEKTLAKIDSNEYVDASTITHQAGFNEF